MNNVVSMVKYYLIHKNADESIIEYIKNKLDNTKVEDLIIIQIELLYTDPSDKLVSSLVNFINSKINVLLTNMDIHELTILISNLRSKIKILELDINKLNETNKKIFEKIKEKDLNKDNKFDDEDSKIAANLIEDNKNNEFLIKRKSSEISSINIWLKNLERSLKRKVNKISLEELFNSYIQELKYINKDDYINKYIKEMSNKIDNILLNNTLLETITNIMPELHRIYEKNSNKKNELYKLLDYYIDLVDGNIKRRISRLSYEEKLVLKDKINAISYEILHNDIEDDDFKALIITNYVKYLY